VTAALRERGRGVPEGGGCWHRRWWLPGPDCQGGWVGSPSGDVVEGEVWRDVP